MIVTNGMKIKSKRIILQNELNLSIVDQHYSNYRLQKCYAVPPFKKKAKYNSKVNSGQQLKIFERK